MQEDPTFRVETDQDTGQTKISGMGELHLEIIVDRLKREFGVEANVGKPQVAYKETIRKEARGDGRYVKQTGGRGQYGHAKIDIEPAPGEGYVFENKIKGGAIPKEYIKPVEDGIREALERGILAGYPMVDVRVRLYDGTFHNVDSSEMAFKIAGSMAFQAGGQESLAGPPRAHHAGRGRDTRRLHGCRDWRFVQPTRPPRGPDLPRRFADHYGDGAAFEHVRLFHRPAFTHPGPGDLLDALREVRRGSQERFGGNRGTGPRAR